jgi:hypothetical protein
MPPSKQPANEQAEEGIEVVRTETKIAIIDKILN